MTDNSLLMTAAVPKAERTVSPLRAAMRSAVRKPTFIFGLSWLLIVVLATVFAGFIAPYDPYQQNIVDSLQLPSAAHLLGTDYVGRDILSRLLHGGGTMLLGALEAVFVALMIGVPAGLQAGFRGGRVDSALSFVANIVLSIPGFVVLVAVVVISANTLVIVMGVLGLLFSASIFRLVRATTQATRSLPYVDAARVAGLSRWRILLRHILPNITGPLVVQAFITYGIALLIAGALAFLGLGLSPLAPSWGQMVYDATQYLNRVPWLLVPVGSVLILTILSVNLIGTAVRDALPHAQRQRLLTYWRLPARLAAPRTGAGSPARADVVTAAASETPDDVLLRVEGLEISFPLEDGWHPVVDGVTLDVRRGTTVALVGESGCGKTLTGLALMGLVPRPGQVTGGRILFDGTDLAQEPEATWQRLRGSSIGLVSQEPMVALDPCFTVGSQLGEALRLHRGGNRRQTREAVRDLLRQVGIANPDAVARSFPHQISGGMAQRVIIALALSGDPELLIADEPTTALDVTIQAEILDLLRTIQEERGMTVIITTHDLGVVADIADEIAVMYAGQIVEFGPAERVLAEPVHPYSRALISALPEGVERGQPLPIVEGSVPLPQNWPASCRFAARCPFVIPACTAAPVAMVVARPDPQSARCVRAHELTTPDLVSAEATGSRT